MVYGIRTSHDASFVICEIHARGFLNEDWSERLRGLRITVERDERNAPVTVLHGELPDAAALNGVLTTLYSLGLSLVSVQSTPVSDLPDNESQPNPFAGSE
ncbi:MAG: hypothetical protein IPF53_09315 [Blastocatellia bacterium]|jgi:hypothetical protein|nr:hypothetical protein [Blastocatellia bacterium]MBK6429108.1 hypothetical protein [Blastocatellia bacterium]